MLTDGDDGGPCGAVGGKRRDEEAPAVAACGPKPSFLGVMDRGSRPFGSPASSSVGFVFG